MQVEPLENFHYPPKKVTALQVYINAFNAAQKWFKKPANVLQASPEANIPPHHQPRLGFLHGKWQMSCPCDTKII